MNIWKVEVNQEKLVAAPTPQDAYVGMQGAPAYDCSSAAPVLPVHTWVSSRCGWPWMVTRKCRCLGKPAAPDRLCTSSGLIEKQADLLLKLGTPGMPGMRARQCCPPSASPSEQLVTSYNKIASKQAELQP